MCGKLQYVTWCVKIRLLYRQPLHLTTTRNCRSPLQADFKEYLEGSSRRDINLLCSFELLNTHDIVNEAEEINGDSISMHPLCLISLLFCWLSVVDSKVNWFGTNAKLECKLWDFTFLIYFLRPFLRWENRLHDFWFFFHG